MKKLDAFIIKLDYIFIGINIGLIAFNILRVILYGAEYLQYILLHIGCIIAILITLNNYEKEYNRKDRK